MKDKLFNELIESLNQAKSIRNGVMEPSRAYNFPEPNVKAIRENIGASQSEFARLISVSLDTIKNWEQARRSPTGPAKVLLKLLEVDPKHTIKTIHS